MNNIWLMIYIIPILMSLVVIFANQMLRGIEGFNKKTEHHSELWHMTTWSLLLSHLVPRLYLLGRDFFKGASLIALELVISAVVALVWYLFSKKYLRSQPTAFYEAELLLNWTQLCQEILPKKSIPLLNAKSRVLPHTRGCENPIFCVSQELLDTLSDTGQRYIMAHFLFQIKSRHHQYRRLFLFCFVLMWYNPLLHLVHMLLQRDFDEIADQLTIAHFGRNHTGGYGMTLIHTYDLHGPEHPLLSRLYRWVGTNQLKARIAKLN